jgi:hypothetical protein
MTTPNIWDIYMIPFGHKSFAQILRGISSIFDSYPSRFSRLKSANGLIMRWDSHTTADIA